MLHTIRRALLTSLSYIIGTVIFAQQYPVSVSTTLIPPYSVFLADYIRPGASNLQVNILPTDQNLLEYRAKLHIVIEGNNIRIETSPTYMPPPLFLSGGLPEIFTGSDLSEYFDVNNLQFTGYSRQEYIRTGRLPEGIYRFSFYVQDYNRNSRVSNIGSATAWLILNDPPILNLPQKGTKLKVYDPQNIMFQWTPRHKGSPNSAFSSEYVFKLYEVWLEGQDPNLVAQTQLPFFETVTTRNRYTYGIADPMLVLGRQYVWVVQARDTESRDLFKNNGQSEAFVFTYGDECKPPIKIIAEAINGPGIKLDWRTDIGQTGFEVRYREKGSTESWYVDQTLLDNLKIYDLLYSRDYECQVRSQCGSFNSEYSRIEYIRTKEDEPKEFTCGGGSGLEEITNTNPKGVMLPGMYFTAGGFDAVVTKVSGGNGIFSGECLVEIPYLNFAMIKHTFENIKINELNQMTEGKLVAVVNPDAPFLKDLSKDDLVLPGGEGIDATTEGGGFEPDTTIILAETIDSLYINSDGEIIAVTEDGEEIAISPDAEDEKVQVQDESGNQYYVDNGQVTSNKPGDNLASGTGGTSVVNNIEAAVALLPQIKFGPGENQNYGYDSLIYDGLKSSYVSTTIRGKEYTIPWKAIATGATEPVTAILPGKSEGFEPSSVSFKTVGATLVSQPSLSGNNKKVTLISGVKDKVDEVTAYYSLADKEGNTQEEELGKLNVITFDKITANLIVVPVNMEAYPGNITTFKQELNSIYGQAVAEWDVTLNNPLTVPEGDWDTDNDGKFGSDDDDNRMNYTDDMKAIIGAYKDQFGRDKDAYYIFLIPHTINGSQSGYMPFKKQHGFIFTQNTKGNLSQVIAHELGHGTFRLRHTFSPENKYQLSQGSTDNLMDYNQGTYLNKYEWDLIHDPENVFTFLQDESEGEINIEGIYFSISGDEKKYKSGDLIYIIGKPELEISIFKSNDKELNAKYCTYNENTVNVEGNTFKIAPKEFNKKETLIIEVKKNLSLNISFIYIKPSVSLLGTGFIPEDEPVFIYSEKEIDIKLSIENEDFPIENLADYIVSWEWDNIKKEGNLADWTKVIINEEVKEYKLKINFLQTSREYTFNALSAPVVSFERSSFNMLPITSYGFDNYEYESYDIHDKFKDEYYVTNIAGNSYKVPWLTCETGNIFFPVRGKIATSPINKIRYNVSWADNTGGDANFEINKNNDNGDIFFDFINSTGSFKVVDISDMRGQVKGQIRIITEARASFEAKDLIPVTLNTSRGITTVPANLSHQLNLKSFNQTFINWVIGATKNVDLIAMSSKYTLSSTQANVIQNSIFDNNSDEISQYLNLVIGEYVATNGIPPVNSCIIFFTDITINNSDGRQVIGKYVPISHVSYRGDYIFIFNGAKDVTWTHELGHSLKLHHIWEGTVLNNNPNAKGKTCNFMDYSVNRNQFWKWQWKKMNSNIR